jgi:hypothetical protein
VHSFLQKEKEKPKKSFLVHIWLQSKLLLLFELGIYIVISDVVFVIAIIVTTHVGILRIL